MESASSNSSQQNNVKENDTCHNVYKVPRFINKSEYCRDPVYYQCPVYPCFLDSTELIVGTIGFILNLSTTIALSRIGKNLKPRHRLLLSLSITDMAISGFHIIGLFYKFPSGFTSRNRYVSVSVYYDLSVIIGNAYTYLQYSALANIILIAMDVFVAVNFPLFHHRVMTRSIAALSVGLAWSCSLLVYVAAFVISIFLKANPVFMYGIFDILSLFCFTALMNLYFIMLWKICSLDRQSENRRITSKPVGTVFAILLTYTVLMMPGFWISAVMTPILVRPGVFSWNLWYTTIKTFQCMCVLNTVCDPVIYILRIQEIRNWFKMIWDTCSNNLRNKCMLGKTNDVPSNQPGVG